MKHASLHALVDTLARGEDPTQAAAAVGLDEQGLAQLTLITRVLEARELRRRRQAWLFGAGLASAVLAGAVLLGAAPALAQVACTQTLPAPLITFCADHPAQASQVNGNFQQLVTWVQQKVGPVGSGNITTGTVTATGNVATSTDVVAGGRLVGARAAISDGVIQRGGTPITGTTDLGLYSRTNGNWLRFVTNGGAARFYNAEGGSGIGTTANFSVETDGSLTSSWGEPEGTHLLPQSFCVIVPIGSGCPANWDAREVRWDTEDENNTDTGKDGRISTGAGNSHLTMRFCCRGW